MSATPPTQATDTAVDTNPDLLMIDNLDSFAEILIKWHEGKVAILNHMLSLPECTEAECDGTTVTLAGDMMDGFKLGIELCLMELGTLPFVVDTQAVDAGF